jgi:hypothetical protein
MKKFRHGWCIILFLSLGELDINLQDLIPTRSVNIKKKIKSHNGVC